MCARLRASTSPSVFFYMDFVFLLLKCCTVYVGFVHMCAAEWVVVVLVVGRGLVCVGHRSLVKIKLP